MIDLDDFNTTHRVVIEPQLLCIVRIDHHGLALGIGVNGVPLDALYFSYYDCAGYIGEDDLALGIGPVQAIGGQMPVFIRQVGTVRIGDFELNPLKRLLIGTRQFVDDQITLWLITELQSDRLAGLDLGRLRRVIQKEPFLCPGFLDDQRRTRLDALNQDGTRGVGGEVAVSISYHSAVALGHEELDIRNGRVIGAGHLLDKKRSHGAVAKIDLDHLLLLAGQVDRLGRGVDDVGAVRGEFFDDVSAGFAVGHREGTIDRSAVCPDDRAAGAAGVAGEVADLEDSPLNGGPRFGIILPYTDGRIGAVVDAEGMPLAGGHKCLLFAGLRHGEPFRGL